MQEPRWFKDTAVTIVHQRQLAVHGGLAGVRDPGLLSSALTRPRNLFHYSRPAPDLAAVAAAYMFGIIKNHPFVDGNKRTGSWSDVCSLSSMVLTLMQMKKRNIKQ